MTSSPSFDLHRTADWLAGQNLSDLDANHADLVDAVDAAALAAGAPAALRPSASDPTPALVRLFNHHACAIQRSQRTYLDAA
jgi:hypothetical protein